MVIHQSVPVIIKPICVVSVLVLALSGFCYRSAAMPVVVVYGGGEDELASMLVELIESEERIDAEVLVVNSPEAVRLSAAMPDLACILIYADHRDDLVELPEPLTAFFEGGGGLVGLREVCSLPAAEELSMEVFPVHGNHTLRLSGSTRAFLYRVGEGMEITEGLPESFEVLSLGTYVSVDSDGDPIQIPGNHRTVYRDAETGSPLVVAHESENGGRSVALPGIMVVSNERVDVYYGNLFLDGNFTTLIANSVVWAMGNSRFEAMEQDLQQEIDEFNAIQEELRSEAESAEGERRTRRLYYLVGFWAGGLVVCGLILFRLVLPPQA